MSSDETLKEFQNTVLSYWKKEGRHTLPWRKTKDPYKILVSEVMLQQTQVTRVIPKYNEFLKKFPTIHALAKAPLSEVLKTWSGLGYNRRAKYLREAAKTITSNHGGKFPKSYKELSALPGIGEYTAKAVRVFAFNEAEVLIETNIRTAYLHHFYSSVLQKTAIADKEILKKATEAAHGQDPRKWHWALMDYGAHLKGKGVKLNQKSAHYSKQSKFKGSLREARGAILRSLGFSTTNEETLEFMLEFPREKFNAALESLYKDGLIEEKDGMVRLALD